MTVKASVSLSPQQAEFARKLVEDGHFPSLAAVVERGLDLVREETEMREEDVAALRSLVERRRQGRFLSEAESHERIEAMIAAKKAEYGL
ncbi:type II toxin-antitoxin system ParD family antitoxin [Rhizobium sp. AQ_MP]|uniref:type II toxin-antitoxin system ParD family antitoxin n=1 Tax=Rhizobium sp. AQ_MP TaxID=2761536 RepID=UPI000DE1463B|nr:type II toxin-antitoxin system ParD family antitoxin [Rhizobium sp. AQ_MP]MBC2772078.1 type II toxin-antitoxin system ParD family antitoxin [Rhizobium sp. AQ_MP]